MRLDRHSPTVGRNSAAQQRTHALGAGSHQRLAFGRVKVERFIVGWVRGAAGIWRRDDDLEREIRFPVPAYLRAMRDSGVTVVPGHDPALLAPGPVQA